MKKTLKKLLICILIIFIINNFFFNNVSLAADAFEDWLTDMLGAVVGLLTWPIRLVALACAWAIDGITSNVALLEGYVNESGSIVKTNPYGADEFKTLTPFHILFNKIALLDANCFNLLDDGSVIGNIRNAIAGWYYVMRTVAAAILLCVLIYVGIRMAITTIASDKAAYKKMLVDWVCSLSLIFLLHYIILFTFAVNDAFIKSLESISKSEELVNAMQNIKLIAMGVSAASIAGTIVFCMLTAQTIALLFSYFKRMLKIAFLVIIAPLITLTYSMDKMGDGKAQALTAWLKEFIYTVMLQTFHCIIYTVFVGMALKILQDDEISRLSTSLGVNPDNITIAGSILAVLCIKFTKDAEEILGKIFDFKGSTSDSSIGAGMMASAALLKNSTKIGKGAKTAFNSVRNLDLGSQGRNARVAAAAIGASLFGVKDKETNERKRLSSDEALDYAESKVTEKEAEKLEKKNSKKYKVDKASNEDVEKLAKEIQASSGVTSQLAHAQARAQLARKTRQQQKEKFNNDHKFIGGVRGTYKNLKEAGKTFRKTETAKFLNDMGKTTFALGVGSFVGSASYGVTGNAFNSLALGAGAMKGTKELLKTSTVALKDNAQDIFDGMNLGSAAEAENEMNTVRALSPILGDNAELQRQLDELLKFVEEACGSDKEEAKSAKATIKNTVAKELKQNPNISNADLMASIESNLQANSNVTDASFNNMKNNDGYNKGLTDVMQMQRRKELYDIMQNAASLGINETAFTKMVTRGYDGSYSTGQEMPDRTNVPDISTIGAANVVQEVIENNQNITRENIQNGDNERSEEDLGEIRQGIQEEIDRLKAEIDSETEETPERSEMEEEITRLSKSIEVIDEHMKSRIEPVLDGYKADYEKAMRELIAEVERAKLENSRIASAAATEAAQKKFDFEVEKIRKEAENKISSLEQNFGKNDGNGVYTSQFTTTLESLKTSESIEIN